jgi:hypothetical protein
MPGEAKRIGEGQLAVWALFVDYRKEPTSGSLTTMKRRDAAIANDLSEFALPLNVQLSIQSR